MNRSAWLEDVQRRCHAAGLDLVQPFGLAAFHSVCAAELRLEDFGREDAQALVVGNSRALWPTLLAAVAASAELRKSPHPLDDYVAASLRAALADVPVKSALYLAHRRAARVIAIQRIADAAGLAELGPAHLSVHPTLGPWLALRAVVVFDFAHDEASDPAPRAPSRCARCAAPCVPALEEALRATKHAPNYGLASDDSAAPAPSGDSACARAPSADSCEPALEASLGAEERAWLAVRDACPVGRGARYGSAQLAYHYGKDRALLGVGRTRP